MKQAIIPVKHVEHVPGAIQFPEMVEQYVKLGGGKVSQRHIEAARRILKIAWEDHPKPPSDLQAALLVIAALGLETEAEDAESTPSEDDAQSELAQTLSQMNRELSDLRKERATFNEFLSDPFHRDAYLAWRLQKKEAAKNDAV
ncbi:hypothetical protein ACFOY8_14430 [Thalassospira xianhensis]|uniref:Uncharacterized protein n=1 Tax=Thalassospira xianhensis MCCC 1A02616 TaxID=1177929 RepID=A0A367UI10_9PROT|nr:hypothetical protein [Thalassospira xianhensis]RCK07651.1 hypothetical protein TH5_00820 [Thalassospira xianhensis MCCC 1A02616]